MKVGIGGHCVVMVGVVGHFVVVEEEGFEEEEEEEEVGYLEMGWEFVGAGG